MRIDHAANEGVVDEVADAMLLYRKRTRQQSIQNSMLTMMQMIETPAAIIVTRANANAQAVAVGDAHAIDGRLAMIGNAKQHTMIRMITTTTAMTISMAKTDLVDARCNTRRGPTPSRTSSKVTLPTAPKAAEVEEEAADAVAEAAEEAEEAEVVVVDEAVVVVVVVDDANHAHG